MNPSTPWPLRSLSLESPEHPSLSEIGKCYFVGIGIDRYEHCPELGNAVQDVTALVEVLVQQYQFEREQVRVLTNEAATRSEVIRLLESLIPKVQPQDSVLIYFAGHGYLNPNTQRGVWFTVESDPEDPSTHLTNSTILDYLKDIPSLHTFLIADACFSGRLFARHRSLEPTGDHQEQQHYERIFVVPSRWGLTSGGIELVADGPEGAHSPFAKALLDSLKVHQGKYLSVWELINQVQKQVGINHHQQPVGNRLFGVDDQGRGQFVFVRDTGTGNPTTRISFSRRLPTAEIESSQASAGSLRRTLLGLIALVLMGFGIGFGLIPQLQGDPASQSSSSVSLDSVEVALTKPDSLDSQEPEPMESTPIPSTQTSQASPQPTPIPPMEREEPLPEQTLASNPGPQIDPRDQGIDQPGKEALAMASLPGGTFIMGFAGGISLNQPPHLVKVGPFRMARTEVSWAEYAAFLDAKHVPKNKALAYVRLRGSGILYDKKQHQYTVRPGYETYPASGISWEGARAFCQWKGGRLPTEAEWEYAARGGHASSESSFSGGNSAEQVAWFLDNALEPESVGQKLPNEFGLFDLSGNVAEWCYDYFDRDAYSHSEITNPRGSASRGTRVVRGGSFESPATQLSVWARDAHPPESRIPSIGCRCVWDQ